MKKFKFIDLFAGIGGMRIPFEEIGGDCVFSSEIDKHAQQTYKDNFNELPLGDIKEIEAKDIPNHDFLAKRFHMPDLKKDSTIQGVHYFLKLQEFLNIIGQKLFY